MAPNRYRGYQIVLNNPTGHIDCDLSSNKIKYACWNLEIGNSGNLHYQIAVYFENNISLKSAKKCIEQICGTNKFHMEYAQDNDANFHYCSKPCNDTNCGRDGCIEVRNGISKVLEKYEYGIKPEKQGKRNDINELYIELKKFDNIKSAFKDANIAGKIGNKLNWAKMVIEANIIEEKFDNIELNSFYPWQKNLYNVLINEKPKQRRIFWVWSISTKTGKTSFGKYLQDNNNAYMKSLDTDQDKLLGRYLQEYINQKIIIVDIPKNWDGRNMDRILNFLEHLSDGGRLGGDFGQSSSKNVYAHIIVLTNRIPPDWDRIVNIKAEIEENEFGNQIII